MQCSIEQAARPLQSHAARSQVLPSDLENIVLTGQIARRQRDRGTRETKYVVQGCTLDGTAAEVVAKVGHTGRPFIITVYVL